jgi:hypothetical protein
MTEIDCDLCTKENLEDDDYYHFSGTINGEFSNHIHVCTDCLMKYKLDNKFIDINKRSHDTIIELV